MNPATAITVYFVIAVFITQSGMKAVSFFMSPRRFRTKVNSLRMALAPVNSTETLARSSLLTRHGLVQVIGRGSTFAAAAVLVYLFLPQLLSRPSIPWPVKGYVAIIPCWVLMETGNALFQLNFIGSGLIVPRINNQPWRARRIVEFWGTRWNCWWSDWLRQVCFRPLRGRPICATTAAFGVSGILHEGLINAPLWLVYHRNLFGTTLLYFAIQVMGVFVERRCFRRKRKVEIALTWLTILLPAPLVLNEGLLRIFHLAS